MKVYDAPNIRNVVLVGHGGSGKTTLASALLFDTGAVSRLGRVEDGTAPTDFDPDEIERQISLQTTLAWAEWKKTKINLLDAPGYANFTAEARAALLERLDIIRRDPMASGKEMAYVKAEAFDDLPALRERLAFALAAR